MLMFFQQDMLAPICFHRVLLLVQARAYILLNSMSYMFLNLKGKDSFDLQVWICSSGFRAVSLNENRMLGFQSVKLKQRFTKGKYAHKVNIN